ncbi:MAG: gluconate 2-dehydrogenase subunit 3 family protein [Bacteroidota bacterium]
MKRRDSLKYLLVGTIGGATVGSASSCKSDTPTDVPKEVATKTEEGLYGRMPAEIEHDKRVKAEIFLNEHELTTIAVLCDIILPATPTAGSATDAKVPEFIEFIVKDIPNHQLPMRGGLMWLDGEANRRFNKEFAKCTSPEQIQIIDDIAYPDPDNEKPEMTHGRAFFNLIRNLTLTGYYTTKMGFDDLGYQGNYANIWDGVPEDILAEHDVAYDPEWLAKCTDQSKRNAIAEWDENGNLMS